MKTITGAIEGAAPFLFNRPLRDPDDKAPGPSTLDAKEAEALTKVYEDKKGLYIPGWNLKVAWARGCNSAKIKLDRVLVGPRVIAGVFVDGVARFDQREYEIQRVFGRIPPKTGSLVMLRRPMLPTGWTLRFRVSVIDEGLVPDLLRLGLETAGLRIGLGAWRPEYGRFVVRDWRVE